MTRKAAVLLMVGGGILTCVALVTRQIHPAMAREAWLGGALGGSLAAFWGGMGLIGFRCRAWAILTLAASAFVLLSQMVKGWMSLGTPDAPGVVAPLAITLMFVVAAGLTAYLPHTGARMVEQPDAVPGRKTSR